MAPDVSMFAPTISTTGPAKVISGLYRIGAIRIDFDCAFTNTVPVDAIRGAGKPEALFLLERPRRSRRPRDRPQRNRPAAPSTCSGRRTCLRCCQRLHLRCRRPRQAIRHGAEGRRRTGLSRSGEPRAEANGERRGFGFLRATCTAPGGIADEHVVVDIRPDRLVARPGTREPGPGARDDFRPASCRTRSAFPERIDVRQGDTPPSRTAAASAARPRRSSAARP